MNYNLKASVHLLKFRDFGTSWDASVDPVILAMLGALGLKKDFATKTKNFTELCFFPLLSFSLLKLDISIL